MLQRYSQKMPLAFAMCLVGVFRVSDAERDVLSQHHETAKLVTLNGAGPVSYEAETRSKGCDCNPKALQDLDDWKPYFKTVELHVPWKGTHGIGGLPFLNKMDCIMPSLGIGFFVEGSAIMEWNRLHQQQVVKAGSVILSVNDVGMDALPPGECRAQAMVDQFAKDCNIVGDICQCNKREGCDLTLTVFDVPNLNPVGLEIAHRAISHVKNAIKYISDFWDPDVKESVDVWRARELEAKLLYIFDPQVRTTIRKAQGADVFNLWTKKHTSPAVVVNDLEHSITNVTVFHKFSDHYKNAGFWPTIAAHARSATSVDLVFKEGFFEFGLDWWLVTWKHDGKLYASVPNNLGRLRDEIEPWVSKVLCTIGEHTAGVVGYLLGYVISDLFTNNERVEGFKGHKLTEEDAGQELDFTIMDFDDKTQVTFSSSAETSSTFAKVIDNDDDNNVRELLEIAEWVLAHPRENYQPADMFCDKLPEKLHFLKPIFKNVINTEKYHHKALQLKWFAKNLIIAIQRLSIQITGADPNQYDVHWRELERQ